MSHWLKRDCPLCGSSSVIEKAEVRAPYVADEMSFEEVAEFWRGFRKDSCFFTFHRCADCGLLYCQNYFTDEQLSSLYSNMGDNSAGVADAVLERTQTGYFKFFKNYGFQSNGNYLELGPDTGLLTKNFATAGASSMYLVEPNNEVRNELRASASAVTDVHIYDKFADIPPNVKFATVAGIHVYDHLVYLKDELTKISQQCDSSASFFLVVHDESSFLRKVLKRKWPPFCLQHPQLFNPMTIEKALIDQGFVDVEVKKSTNWFPIRHIGSMISSLFGLNSVWTRYLPSRELPLRLGNMIVGAKLTS
jgi:hypothetical protein